MSAVQTPQSADGILERIPTVGTSRLCGLTIPVDGTAGYAPGCLFIKYDGAAGANLYKNEGNETSCQFKAIPSGGSTGAAAVGIADAGGFTVQTTVEGALAEIYQNLFSNTGGTINMPLSVFREVDANGTVGNTAAGAGTLSADTTPVFGNTANHSFAVNWATGNADPIQAAFAVPSDMDTTANATLTLYAKGGATNAPSFGIITGFNDQAEAGSVTVAGGANTTIQALTHTITAANMPASGARFFNVRIIPNTHAADVFSLFEVKLEYKRKLLTS